MKNTLRIPAIITLALIVLVILCAQSKLIHINSPDIQQEIKRKNNSEKYYIKFYSPFDEDNRNSYDTIKRRIIGRYGDYRRSPVVGHIHAGIDLKGDFSETVYPIGFGPVIEISRSFPNTTIVIKHYLENGDSLFSQYTHVEDIRVRKGDWIIYDTPIARLFTQEELKLSKFGTLNHLHLEIRKRIDDNGRASWTSMNLSDLNKYCIDPLKFYSNRLTK